MNLTLRINDCIYKRLIMRNLIVLSAIVFTCLMASCSHRTCPTYTKGIKEVPQEQHPKSQQNRPV